MAEMEHGTHVLVYDNHRGDRKIIPLKDNAQREKVNKVITEAQRSTAGQPVLKIGGDLVAPGAYIATHHIHDLGDLLDTDDGEQYDDERYAGRTRTGPTTESEQVGAGEGNVTGG